jgi:hypothetical protein
MFYIGPSTPLFTEMRTDDNNNPTAFTVDLAAQAGLLLTVDYIDGTPFPSPSKLITAKLLGDPVAITIRVIDVVGFYTQEGGQRWEYIAMPKFLWNELLEDEQRDIIGFMYQREGGVAMRRLFPHYGAL